MIFDNFSLDKYVKEYKSFSDLAENIYLKIKFEQREKIEEFFGKNYLHQIQAYLGAEKHHFKSSECEISYFELGKKGGEILLFLHGFADQKENFFKMAKILSDKFHLFVPDVPGFGESSKFETTYNANNYSKWIRNFIEHITKEKIHIMGNSMGGGIALQIALDAPKLLRSLTLLNAGAVHPRHTHSLYDELNRGENIFDAKNMDDYNHFLKRIFHVEPYTPTPLKFHFGKHFIENRDWMLKILNDVFGGIGKNRPSQEIFDICLNDKLKKILTPTLIIWGEHDTFFPLEVASILHVELMHSELVVFEDAGHATHIEAAAKASKAFERFAKKISHP